MTDDVRLKPAGWQVTATTVRCEKVDDFVTIMVNKDWSTSCAWYHRHKGQGSPGSKGRFNTRLKGKIDACNGPECPLVVQYRDRLIHEEFGSC
jgi:hypothetical protein